jgi:hypothetical protein
MRDHGWHVKEMSDSMCSDELAGCVSIFSGDLPIVEQRIESLLANGTDFFEIGSGLADSYTLVQGLLCDFYLHVRELLEIYQLFYVRVHVAVLDHDGVIPMDSVLVDSDVEVYVIAILEGPLVGNSVTEDCSSQKFTSRYLHLGRCRPT